MIYKKHFVKKKLRGRGDKEATDRQPSPSYMK